MSEKEKPTVLKVIPENVPEELKKLKQWAVWNLREKEDGTWDKPPLTPSGSYANVNNPETWSTFEEVVAALPRFDGISFVITKESGIVGIDIDHIRESPQKQEILKEVENFQSYTEKSPSDNGVRVFVRGIKEGTVCHKGDFEIYDEKKFLSVTGHVISPQKTINRAVGALVTFYRKHFPEDKPAASTTRKESPDMSNEEVLKHLMDAENSSKFKTLYEKGDLTAYGGDESSADLALCLLISFYTQKPEQIIEIFSTSKLGKRDKWIEREDYRERTVNKSLSILKKTYQPQPEKKSHAKSTPIYMKDVKKEAEADETMQRIEKLIEEAAQKGETGKRACKKWLHEHLIDVVCVDRKYWKMDIKFKGKVRIEDYPELYYTLAEAFDLQDKAFTDIYEKIQDWNAHYHTEKKKQKEIVEALEDYSDEVKQIAFEELFNGDPYQYVLDVWKENHIGDEAIGMTLPICATSALVTGENDGLHFKPSGESGKGKTSGVDAFLKLLPPSMMVRGGISDKFIYYDAGTSIRDGSIIFMDDRDLSDNLKGVVKNAISNFQNPEAHKTVLDGKPVSYTPAKRLVWLFASVDGFDDEQLSNRFLMADVDNSTEQDDKVAEYQGRHEKERALGNGIFKRTVCQCIFNVLNSKTYNVLIPFSDEIFKHWRHKKNRRNLIKFFDIIKAVCVFKVFQRDTLGPYILATYEDFERAVEIYGQTAKQSNVALTAAEMDVINYFIQNNDYSDDEPEYKKSSINEIAKALKKKYRATQRIVEGRPERDIAGLDGKIPSFYKEKQSERPYSTVYWYEGVHDFEQYESFVGKLSQKTVEALETEFISEFKSRKQTVIQTTEEIIQAYAQEEISVLSHCPTSVDTIVPLCPILSQGMGQSINNNSKHKNLIKKQDCPKNRKMKEEEEKCSLDCKELESNCLTSNSLQSKLENNREYSVFPELGQSSVIKDSTEATDTFLCLPQSLGHSGTLGTIVSTDVGTKLNPIAKYSQKPDFIITPENLQLHEENLQQISLIPDPTELDYFNQYVEGNSIGLLPSSEEEQRAKEFEEDFLYLIPDVDHEEKQRFFNLYNWVHQRCKKFDEKVYLEQLFEENRDFDDDLIEFFAECMEQRGEFEIARFSA